MNNTLGNLQWFFKMGTCSETKEFENSYSRKYYFNYVRKSWKEFAELLGLSWIVKSDYLWMSGLRVIVILTFLLLCVSKIFHFSMSFFYIWWRVIFFNLQFLFFTFKKISLHLSHHLEPKIVKCLLIILA